MRRARRRHLAVIIDETSADVDDALDEMRRSRARLSVTVARLQAVVRSHAGE